MVFQLEGKISDEKSSFRLETQKEFMDTTIFVFVQTFFGLPVWEAGLSVTIDKKRQRILGSFSSAYDEIEVSIATKSILFKKTEALSLYKSLGLEREIKSKKTEAKIQSERLLIYRYEAGKRTNTPLPDKQEERNNLKNEEEFILPLPPVSGAIKEGNFYVVREIIFSYPVPTAPTLVWRAFIEIATGAVLYLRAFGSNVTAMVFQTDPITKGSGFTPSASDANLSSIRDNVTLSNLNPSSGSGVQSLIGTLVSVQAVDAPAVAAPT